MIQDVISAKTYFFLLPYFDFTSWQNKVGHGGPWQYFKESTTTPHHAPVNFNHISHSDQIQEASGAPAPTQGVIG
jgi:hypothetical protein